MMKVYYVSSLTSILTNSHMMKRDKAHKIVDQNMNNGKDNNIVSNTYSTPLRGGGNLAIFFIRGKALSR